MSIFFVTVNGVEEFPPPSGGGPNLSNAIPQPLGVADPGTSPDASRGDHVHALPTIPALSNAIPQPLGIADPGSSPDASRADHVHPLPTTLVQVGTAGADSARPTASTSLIGSLYTATDTAVRYLCESNGAGGARWCRVGGNGTEGRDTTAVVTGGTLQSVGSANITGNTVTGFALAFSLAAIPSGGCNIMSVSGGGAGWALEIGFDATDRGRLGIVRSGLSAGRRIFTSASVTGALDTPHTIAVRFDGANTIYSLDGAAASTAADTGTPTWGNAPVRLQRSEVSFNGSNMDHLGFKIWSSSLTDADLLSVSGAFATGRIPDVSGGTVVTDWAAARYPEWQATQRVVRGSTPTIMTWTGAPPLVIR